MSVSDFQILSRLGEGAYSSVYKVKRISDNQIYALKKVKLMNLSDKEKINALNEVRIIASIRHPNIILYKEAFLDEKSNSLCIVMEFCDNGDLFQKITEFQKKKTLFPETEIFHIFVQIVKGLNELHSLKILHRDLKSANIFLCKDGSVKLGDMNVSKVAKKGLLYTQTGTPYYASPEVWKDTPYESKSDIWSLGCVLYEMTTLKPPFRGEDMEALYKKVIRGQYPRIPPHYSQDLANVIRSLLQVTPHMRPSCQKILAMQPVLRHLSENQIYETDELSKQLMQTIRIPKNLHYLTDRLPKPNYQPLKVRKSENKKMVQTMAGYSDSNSEMDGGPKLLLPKISGNIRPKNPRLSSNNQSGLNSVISDLRSDYKSHSVEQYNGIQPLVPQKRQIRKSDNYSIISQNSHSRNHSKHLQYLNGEESLSNKKKYQHKQILNLINKRDKSHEKDTNLTNILDVQQMRGRQKENIYDLEIPERHRPKKKYNNHISQKYQIESLEDMDLINKYPRPSKLNQYNRKSPDMMKLEQSIERNKLQMPIIENKKNSENRLPSLNSMSQHQQAQIPPPIKKDNMKVKSYKMEKNLEEIKDIYRPNNKAKKQSQQVILPPTKPLMQKNSSIPNIMDIEKNMNHPPKRNNQELLDQSENISQPNSKKML